MAFVVNKNIIMGARNIAENKTDTVPMLADNRLDDRIRSKNDISTL